jgi:hypothetical protein
MAGRQADHTGGRRTELPGGVADGRLDRRSAVMRPARIGVVSDGIERWVRLAARLSRRPRTPRHVRQTRRSMRKRPI